MHMAEKKFEKPSKPPSEEWVRHAEQLVEDPVAIMWRPAGGEQYVEGVTVVPWEGAARKIEGKDQLEEASTK